MFWEEFSLEERQVYHGLSTRYLFQVPISFLRQTRVARLQTGEDHLIMYCPDLTPYCYLVNHRPPNVLNIGWLDTHHPFPQQKASEELLDALFEQCFQADVRTRGYHACEFCDEQKRGLEVRRHGREIWLGSAEITVKGKDGKIYAAPNLIYHYVAAHDYDPPQEFVEALLAKS
jgi:hypothetical protein